MMEINSARMQAVTCPDLPSMSSPSPLWARRRGLGMKIMIDAPTATTSEASTSGSVSERIASGAIEESVLALASETIEEMPVVAMPSAADPDMPAVDRPEVFGKRSAYTTIKRIGQGSFSRVSLAASLEDGSRVALKETRSDDLATLAAARREYGILSGLRHPFIIKAFDFFLASQFEVTLVLEHFKGSELERAVRGSPAGFFSEQDARFVGSSLLSAVAYLHERGIVHRDIKPANVLVSQRRDDLRLLDFNTAKLEREGLLSPAGTRLYAAPEVVSGGSPSAPADVYAVGLCLHIALSGSLPSQVSEEEFDDEAKRPGGSVALLGHPWDDVTDVGKEVVKHALVVREDLRPGAADILTKEWFRLG